MFDFVSFFPRAVMQGIPLLLGATGETLTEKSVLSISGLAPSAKGILMASRFFIETNCHFPNRAKIS